MKTSLLYLTDAGCKTAGIVSASLTIMAKKAVKFGNICHNFKTKHLKDIEIVDHCIFYSRSFIEANICSICAFLKSLFDFINFVLRRQPFIKNDLLLLNFCCFYVEF